jgi:group I intron endonuclease
VKAYYNEINPAYRAYAITNLATGKLYVGITVRSLRRRWTDHLRAARDGVNTALYRAMRKHGVISFSIVQIASALSREALKALEKDLIAQYGSLAPRGYNLTKGGDGVDGMHPDIVARTAEKNRGRRHTETARLAIGAAHSGHEVTAATRAAIGAAHRGKKLSEEHRQKLSIAKLGKKMPPRTPEHAARISAGLVAAHARRRLA